MPDQRAAIGSIAKPGTFFPLRDATALAHGVRCETCHAPHDAPNTPVAVCADCHAFPFQNHTVPPGVAFELGTTPSQDTVSEWASGWAADLSCATCHYPDGSHTLPGGHLPGLLLDAITPEVLVSPTTVTISLTAMAPHRIPTGDPFRRLDFRLCEAGKPGPLPCPALDQALFRRVFVATAFSWDLLRDTTIPPSTTAPSTVTQTLARPDAASRWELWYRFGDARLEALLSPADVGYLVASGDL